MNDFKRFALELHLNGLRATMDNARTFVLDNYDRVLPAYWLNPAARIQALDALMETRAVGDYESSLHVSLRLSCELERALEHAASMIQDEMLELEYDEKPKVAPEDNISPEEIPY